MRLVASPDEWPGLCVHAARAANSPSTALCKTGDVDAFAHAMVTLSGHPPEALRAKAVLHFKSELSFPDTDCTEVTAFSILFAAPSPEPQNV